MKELIADARDRRFSNEFIGNRFRAMLDDFAALEGQFAAITRARDEINDENRLIEKELDELRVALNAERMRCATIANDVGLSGCADQAVTIRDLILNEGRK